MIRLVINSVPTAPGGGLTNLLGLLEGWRTIDADLDITVLASRPETIQALERAGFGGRVHAVPLMGAVKRQVWQRFSLPKLLKQLKADLVLTNSFFLPRTPCPQVVHHQNLWTCFAKGFLPYLKVHPKWLLLSLMARRGLAKANANVFISEHVRVCSERLVPKSKTKNQTIYYGLSELYESIRGQASDAGRRPFTLCALQAQADYKRNEDLILALADLVRRAPQHNWQLEIAGWGDFSQWQKMAEEHGVADRIKWLGFLNSQQTAELLRTSACLVYPSTFEGFGIPLIEAFASRCPVVAVDCTAIPEVAGDAAMLVPPHSPEKIADCIERICTDSAWRTTLVSRGLAKSRRFSWARSARQFCHVFTSVLKRPITAALPERELVPAADGVVVPAAAN